MKISAQEHDGYAILTVSGEFTADDVETFNRTHTRANPECARHVILDCQHLEFIDSAGLEACLELQSQLGSSGRQIRLVAVDETVKTILDLTRLSLALESYPNLEKAVRSTR